MERYLTLDTAYWDPRVLAAASWLNQQQAAAGRPERVLVIFFYLFDPFVQDIGGYCGGWTPTVVQSIEDAGYIAMPIVTMRPAVAGGMLTPDEIKSALAKYPLGARPVHIKIVEDQETGSFTGAAWSQALGAAMETELYGSVGTVLSDYSSGISAIWIGSYPGIGVLPPPDLAHIPGVPDSAWPDDRAWQYVGSAAIAGADVDVSISNIALDGGSEVTRDEMIQVLNDQYAKTFGIGGSATAWQDGPAEIVNRTRDAATIAGWANGTLELLKAHLATFEAAQAAILKALTDAGGHPADVPILAALDLQKAAVVAMQAGVDHVLTSVAAIQEKQDKVFK